MTKTARRKRSEPRDRHLDGPTPERLAQMGERRRGGPTRGNAHRPVREASPLECLYERGLISQEEYQAGQRYVMHWHEAGLEPSVRSVNFDRVPSGEIDYSAMAKTERQAEHRKFHRAAVGCIGIVNSRIGEAVCCEEFPIGEVARQWSGYTDGASARAEVRGRLKAALEVLVGFYQSMREAA